MKRNMDEPPIFHNKIFEGDCVDLSKKYLPTASVDAIVTDPPRELKDKRCINITTETKAMLLMGTLTSTAKIIFNSQSIGSKNLRVCYVTEKECSLSVAGVTLPTY